MSSIINNFHTVQQRIQHACHQQQRPRSSVHLLAVSKTKPASMVEDVYQLGQRAFGENYVQEGITKIIALSHLSAIEWHYIGPLQSNKTRDVAEHFDWVETVERERIAQRLNEQRPDHKAPLNVLVQVNISQEPQKSGLLPADTLAFARSLQRYPRLRLRGLMCIAEANAGETALHDQFSQMQQLFHALQQEFSDIDTLSMGMSGDMDLAIACGSTEIRIGTDIFGARN